MTTHEVKIIVKRELRRPIGIDELEAIAIEKGKVKPKKSRFGGGTSYNWEESEISEVLSKLKEN